MRLKSSSHSHTQFDRNLLFFVHTPSIISNLNFHSLQKITYSYRHEPRDFSPPHTLSDCTSCAVLAWTFNNPTFSQNITSISYAFSISHTLHSLYPDLSSATTSNHTTKIVVWKKLVIADNIYNCRNRTCSSIWFQNWWYIQIMGDFMIRRQHSSVTHKLFCEITRIMMCFFL